MDDKLLIPQILGQCELMQGLRKQHIIGYFADGQAKNHLDDASNKHQDKYAS